MVVLVDLCVVRKSRLTFSDVLVVREEFWEVRKRGQRGEDERSWKWRTCDPEYGLVR